ncbi:hypothetical protein K2173_014819 [Erythroxylum novogranatense]|uniref:Growth-regulating factor n=1 Tax=Erythroxylum novogranatense TaxID=1862640 RepID=A0AAV8TFP0_9ROSI|nr:hypothetical protein K2173_014819 [Erythroxylum novogranatense]
MNFGALGLDGFVGPEHIGASSQVSAPETKRKILESSSAMHEGSSCDEWRSLKMVRIDDVSVPKTMPLHQASPFSRSNVMVSSDTRQREHMLSFSSPKAEATPFLSTSGGLMEKSAQNNSGFPYYHQLTTAAYSRSSGSGTGSLNGSLHGPFSGTRGPFSPSQWMELEHQALIYKYISANVPVPSNLLIPLKKSLYPYGLSGASAGSFPPNSLGWGAFHLGYGGNNNDPEPGRCRRTDGKKWRCSRDAVVDQKYCERHINRGRHRSRKPVEGQSGHAATVTTNSKVVPMTSSMSTSVITSGGTTNSLAIAQKQFKSLLPTDANSSAVKRTQDVSGKTIVSSAVKPKSEESTFTIPKQDQGIVESSLSEFGFVSSDSLLNPSQTICYMNSRNCESFLNFSDKETQDQHPLRQFMDDWPKNHGSRSVISWPEELKSDWTQLSMSIPMVSTDFSSSSSSPTQDKLVPSPLKLSHEFDPIEMISGASGFPNESSQKQANWIPISWGTSMCGPLGEAFSITSGGGNTSTYKSSSALNLLNEGWDGSQQLGSSPTGVLQKTNFVSLSNSSSGGSPRAESKKNNDGTSLCDDVISSTVVSSSCIPSL